MLLSPGTSLGPYTVLEPLGAGGMGEVYRARDRRLGRDVALKVLTDETSDDPDRLRRLEQEARAASSLNHPNVVVVYEIGEADLPGRIHPIRFIAMELLKGESLSSTLSSGPLGTRRFLDLAVQLADGLAAAHDSGLIHRDLKPSNVIVEPEGRIKMLDFGLARLVAPHGHETSAPTGDPLTQPGTVLGTIGYMAPEQVRGEPATAASDQFSLGCIFYEMVTGRRAFHRQSRGETLSAILKEDPRPIEDLNPAVPPPIRWVVERCLAKSPRERYASTRDLVRDLQKLREHAADPVLRSSPLGLRHLRRRTALRLGLGFLAAMAASAVASVLVYRHLNSPLTPEFRRLTFRQGLVSRALFVPNSNAILYSASWDGQPGKTYLTLPGSSGVDRSLDSEPQLPMAFTGDGAQALVLAGAANSRVSLMGQLCWWPTLGGKLRPVLSAAGWADWSRRRHRLLVVRNVGAERILELRGAEGEVQHVLFRTNGSVHFPRFSPDETTVAFVHHPVLFEDSGEVLEVGLDGRAARPLTPRFSRCFGLAWNGVSGEVWFTASRATHSSSLWAVSRSGRLRHVQAFAHTFVLQDVGVDGEHCLLTDEDQGVSLLVRQAGEPPTEWRWLGWTMVNDISPDERNLLFTDSGAEEESPNGIWIRRTGDADAVRVGDGDWACFADDGKAVIAATSPPSGPRQLFLIPLQGGGRRLLASSSTNLRTPSWTRHGVLFVKEDSGKSNVWIVQTDGHGERSLGAAGCEFPVASPVRPVFVCIDGETYDRISIYPLEGGPGRLLFKMPDGSRLANAQWDKDGAQVKVITRQRRVLTLDSASGVILDETELPVPPGLGAGRLFQAVLSPSGNLQAYSLERYNSTLYLAMFPQRR